MKKFILDFTFVVVGYTIIKALERFLGVPIETFIIVGILNIMMELQELELKDIR